MFAIIMREFINKEVDTMISTLENGAWLLNGVELIEDSGNAMEAVAAKSGKAADKAAAKQGTIAYG